MPSPVLRRSVLAALVLLVLAGTILAVVPYLASTRIVRDRIAVEMSAWTGYRVEIGAPPEIDLWPRFRAVLTNVTLSAWDTPSDRPVIRAKRVDISLSALAAMRGDAEFTAATVTSPELIVKPGPDGRYLPERPMVGRITAAVEAARMAVRNRPDAPDTSALPDEPFGFIRVVDGRVSIDGTGEELVGGIDGAVDWSSLNEAGRVSGKAVYRGEEFSVDLKSSNPLLLVAGGTTDLSLEVTSKSASASFRGKATLREHAYVDGDLHVETPSLALLAAWIGKKVPAEAEIGSASLTGQITGDSQHLKLDGAQIEVNGSKGTGAVEFAYDKGMPGVSGSLDFASLDATSLVNAFAPLTGGAASASTALNIDFRLSAARAKLGAIALEKVAATVQIKDRMTVFDISDATAFGGTVQAGLRFDRSLQNRTVEMRLLASDVDGGALGSAAGMSRLLPIGRGTVSVILKGPADTLHGMLEHADGSVSASFGPGAISGLDLDEFMRRSKAGGFFPLAEVANGNLPVDGLDVEASVSKGVAAINRGVIRIGDRFIRIAGIVPYIGRGLALTGTLGPQSGPDDASFFVGGSWDEPFISPTLANPPLE